MKIVQLFAGFAAASSLDTLVKGSADLTQMIEQVSQMDDVSRPCIRMFLEGCAYCVENIQIGSPFCDESDPNFNGFVCAIQLNKCLYTQLDGLLDCPKE